MTDETEYRVEYKLTRRQPGEEDFAEIGFGSSGAWHSVQFAAHIVHSDIENGTWETEPGQPAPENILADVREALSRDWD